MVRSFNPFECLAEQRQLNNMWTNGNIAVRCGFFNNLERPQKQIAAHLVYLQQRCQFIVVSHPLYLERNA